MRVRKPQITAINHGAVNVFTCRGPASVVPLKRAKHSAELSWLKAALKEGDRTGVARRP